jgi:murein L,D-transpeptidase YcbB/YkuD
MTTTFKVFLVTFILFTSCRSKKDGSEKTIPSRNYSINSKNAYSDLFFDSTKLVAYIRERHVPDSVGLQMTNFYNNRNYQFAWFSSDGPTEQARGFWNMYNYYLDNEKEKAVDDDTLEKSMNRIMAVDEDYDWNNKTKKLLPTELKLTDHFLRFFLENTDKKYLKRKELPKFIPAVKINGIEFADSFLNAKNRDNKYYDMELSQFRNLKQWLGNYMEVYKRGGWPVVNSPALAFKKHKPSPTIAILKKRLQMSGDLPGNDSTQMWNDTLTVAVKNFQERHGFTPSGELTDGQLTVMNISVAYRIKQLLMNMSRMLWMIQEPEGKFMYVNIPEYQLHVTENGKEVFNMPVVVGKQGNNTRIFSGNLNQVVFAPYWNLPVNIIKEEILPEMDANPNYLEEHNMEVVDNMADGTPLIRQKPGEDNALGRVKFLFPNSFDIYFHDTPAKSFFSKDKRAYSHGCIRLSDPVKMVHYVLGNEKGWNDEAIDSALNRTEEKTVKIKDPIPVLITYYTAWTDGSARIHFAEDIYGHDKALAAKMFVD